MDSRFSALEKIKSSILKVLASEASYKESYFSMSDKMNDNELLWLNLYYFTNLMENLQQEIDLAGTKTSGETSSGVDSLVFRRGFGKAAEIESEITTRNNSRSVEIKETVLKPLIHEILAKESPKGIVKLIQSFETVKEKINVKDFLSEFFTDYVQRKLVRSDFYDEQIESKKELTPPVHTLLEAYMDLRYRSTAQESKAIPDTSSIPLLQRIVAIRPKGTVDVYAALGLYREFLEVDDFPNAIKFLSTAIARAKEKSLLDSEILAELKDDKDEIVNAVFANLKAGEDDLVCLRFILKDGDLPYAITIDSLHKFIKNYASEAKSDTSSALFEASIVNDALFTNLFANAFANEEATRDLLHSTWNTLFSIKSDSEKPILLLCLEKLAKSAKATKLDSVAQELKISRKFIKKQTSDYLERYRLQNNLSEFDFKGFVDEIYQHKAFNYFDRINIASDLLKKELTPSNLIQVYSVINSLMSIAPIPPQQQKNMIKLIKRCNQLNLLSNNILENKIAIDNLNILLTKAVSDPKELQKLIKGIFSNKALSEATPSRIMKLFFNLASSPSILQINAATRILTTINFTRLFFEDIYKLYKYIPKDSALSKELALKILASPRFVITDNKKELVDIIQHFSAEELNKLCTDDNAIVTTPHGKKLIFELALQSGIIRLSEVKAASIWIAKTNFTANELATLFNESNFNSQTILKACFNNEEQELSNLLIKADPLTGDAEKYILQKISRDFSWLQKIQLSSMEFARITQGLTETDYLEFFTRLSLRKIGETEVSKNFSGITSFGLIHLHKFLDSAKGKKLDENSLIQSLVAQTTDARLIDVLNMLCEEYKVTENDTCYKNIINIFQNIVNTRPEVIHQLISGSDYESRNANFFAKLWVTKKITASKTLAKIKVVTHSRDSKSSDKTPPQSVSSECLLNYMALKSFFQELSKPPSSRDDAFLKEFLNGARKDFLGDAIISLQNENYKFEEIYNRMLYVDASKFDAIAHNCYIRLMLSLTNYKLLMDPRIVELVIKSDRALSPFNSTLDTFKRRLGNFFGYSSSQFNLSGLNFSAVLFLQAILELYQSPLENTPEGRAKGREIAANIRGLSISTSQLTTLLDEPLYGPKLSAFCLSYSIVPFSEENKSVISKKLIKHAKSYSYSDPYTQKALYFLVSSTHLTPADLSDIIVGMNAVEFNKVAEAKAAETKSQEILARETKRDNKLEIETDDQCIDSKNDDEFYISLLSSPEPGKVITGQFKDFKNHIQSPISELRMPPQDLTSATYLLEKMLRTATQISILKENNVPVAERRYSLLRTIADSFETKDLADFLIHHANDADPETRDILRLCMFSNKKHTAKLSAIPSKLIGLQGQIKAIHVANSNISTSLIVDAFKNCFAQNKLLGLMLIEKYLLEAPYNIELTKTPSHFEHLDSEDLISLILSTDLDIEVRKRLTRILLIRSDLPENIIETTFSRIRDYSFIDVINETESEIIKLISPRVRSAFLKTKNILDINKASFKTLIAFTTGIETKDLKEALPKDEIVFADEIISARLVTLFAASPEALKDYIKIRPGLTNAFFNRLGEVSGLVDYLNTEAGKPHVSVLLSLLTNLDLSDLANFPTWFNKIIDKNFDLILKIQSKATMTLLLLSDSLAKCKVDKIIQLSKQSGNLAVDPQIYLKAMQINTSIEKSAGVYLANLPKDYNFYNASLAIEEIVLQYCTNKIKPPLVEDYVEFIKQLYQNKDSKLSYRKTISTALISALSFLVVVNKDQALILFQAINKSREGQSLIGGINTKDYNKLEHNDSLAKALEVVLYRDTSLAIMEERNNLMRAVTVNSNRPYGEILSAAKSSLEKAPSNNVILRGLYAVGTFISWVASFILPKKITPNWITIAAEKQKLIDSANSYSYTPSESVSNLSRLTLTRTNQSQVLMQNGFRASNAPGSPLSTLAAERAEARAKVEAEEKAAAQELAQAEAQAKTQAEERNTAQAAARAAAKTEAARARAQAHPEERAASHAQPETPAGVQAEAQQHLARAEAQPEQDASAPAEPSLPQSKTVRKKRPCRL